MPDMSMRCPTCGGLFHLAERHVGRKVRCKGCGTVFVVAAAEAPDLPEGWQGQAEILDLYDVRRLLGRGGMGEVYLVHHRGWDVDLAVKTPRADRFATEQDKERFESECRTWVDLGLHPHVVSCHYVRRVGGTPSVFAEYVPGGSLKEWIEGGRLYEGGPAEALARTLDVAIQFAWGLHYAHQRGLVHQDVKPANVMMAGDGTAKVTDFGLARARAAAGEAPEGRPAAGSPEDVEVSYAGMTPAYCSPEQARKNDLTPATDIWSWGLSVVAMFAGQRTWASGTTASAVLARLLETRPANESIPQMPEALAGLLRRCFEPDAAARPADFAAVARELAAICADAVGRPYERQEPCPADLLADGLNNRALSLLDLARPEEAERLLDDALASDALHLEATYNAGLLRWRSGRLADDALLKRLAAAGRRAGGAEARLLTARVHLERGDADGAVAVLSEADGGAGDGGDESLRAALAAAEAARGAGRRCAGSFEAHPAGVTCLAPSADGGLLTGGADAVLCLWDLATGRCVRKYKDHDRRVLTVAASADGAFILSGGWDKTLRIWDASTAACLAVCEHEEAVTSAAFATDGREAISACQDGRLRIWEVPDHEVEEPKRLKTLRGHDKAVLAVAAARQGRACLSGGADATVRLWDLETRQARGVLSGHADAVQAVAISPDGRAGLSGGADHTVRLWDLAAGRCVRTLTAHGGPVTSVALSPDGRLGLSCGLDRTVRLWDLASGRCLRTFDEHRLAVSAVAFAPDGRSGYSAGQDKAVRIWQLTGPPRPQQLALCRPRPAGEVAASARRVAKLKAAAGSSLASGGAERAYKLAAEALAVAGYAADDELIELQRQAGRRGRAAGLRMARPAGLITQHAGRVLDLAVSADGRRLLSGGSDGAACLFELPAGTYVKTLHKYDAPVPAVALTRDGATALMSEQGSILFQARPVDDAGLKASFAGHDDAPAALAVSPDGQLALSGSADGTVRLWSLRHGSMGTNLRMTLALTVGKGSDIRKLEGHTAAVTSVALSPDGRLAASAGADETVRLWDLAAGQCLGVLTGHAGAVNGVAFSPDGRCVLSAGSDRTLRLWDLAAGQCRAVLAGHAEAVNDAAISPDGQFALSAGAEGTVRLWRLADGQCLHVFEGHAAAVTAVGFSPDGRLAISASEDATIRLWELIWDVRFPKAAAEADLAALRGRLEAFLTRHCPYADDGVARTGTPAWDDDGLAALLADLARGGYGWLGEAPIRKGLEKRTASWRQPAPLTVAAPAPVLAPAAEPGEIPDAGAAPQAAAAEDDLADARAREELRELFRRIEREAMGRFLKRIVPVAVVWFFGSIALAIWLGLWKGLICFVLGLFLVVVPLCVVLLYAAAKRLVNTKYHDRILRLAARGHITGEEIKAAIETDSAILHMPSMFGGLDYTLSRCGRPVEAAALSPEEARDELTRLLRKIESEITRSCVMVPAVAAAVLWLGGALVALFWSGWLAGLLWAVLGFVGMIVACIIPVFTVVPGKGRRLFNETYGERIVSLAVQGRVSVGEIGQQIEKRCSMLNMAWTKGLLAGTLSRIGPVS